jgi:hypothetical protein
MSEIHAVIRLRHGTAEAGEAYVASLPDWVVDEWTRRCLALQGQICDMPQKRLIVYWRLLFLPDVYGPEIHGLLVEYYSDHHE